MIPIGFAEILIWGFLTIIKVKIDLFFTQKYICEVLISGSIIDAVEKTA